MMFAQRVRPDELIDLLAAESYDPVLMKYCGYTKNSPKLGDFITDKARLGVTGTIANAYVPEGTAAAIPYLTTKQVDGLYAHLDGCKYITADADQEWSHCRVPDGAIVLNKSGNVGASAIVACAPYAYVNTVSDLINIRPRRPGTDGGGRAIDSGYLVVFLNSPYGQSQLQRLSGGAVFDHVSLFAVPEIRIQEPNPLAQRYIGDKVRQAERLRERARLVHTRLQNAASEFFGRYSPSPKTRSYRTGALAIANRVDAWFYNPRFVHATNAIEAAGIHLTELGKLAPGITNGGTPRTAVFGETGVPWIRGKDFVHGDVAITSLPLLDHASEQTIARSRTKRGDLLLSIKGTVGDVAVVDASLEGCNINQDVARIPLGSETEAQLLALFLESDIGQVLMERQVYGAINAFLSLENLRELVVPNIGEVPEAVRQRLATMRSSVMGLRRGSGVLIASSTQLAEQLIDGRLTEAEVVTAQKAIEAGDRSADREILKALRQSDAPHAKPLIADVDALYALLDGSEGKDA